MVLLVNERTFSQEVLQSPVPVLVNFEAPWCGLCRVVHPLLSQIKSNLGDNIKLVGINADNNFKLSNTYKLKSLPTLLLIEGGVVKQRLEGFSNREDLLNAFEIIKAYVANRSLAYSSPIKAELGTR
ncbi:MAG: thioredoxin family protein [Scytonematopsis contorta HA4267-MV1]|jgi:thioredoxin 1|nr:thioredoxin family protein [Scytonematopsis contorta HA4267-MV1]